MTSHYLIAWLLVAKRNCCASSVNKAVLLLKKLCGSKLCSKIAVAVNVTLSMSS